MKKIFDNFESFTLFRFELNKTNGFIFSILGFEYSNIVYNFNSDLLGIYIYDSIDDKKVINIYLFYCLTIKLKTW